MASFFAFECDAIKFIAKAIDATMRIIGRYMQIAALVALPTGMLLELSGVLGRSFGLNDMLLVLIFGVVLFITGRMFEGYGPR